MAEPREIILEDLIGVLGAREARTFETTVAFHADGSEWPIFIPLEAFSDADRPYAIAGARARYLRFYRITPEGQKEHVMAVSVAYAAPDGVAKRERA